MGRANRKNRRRGGLRQSGDASNGPVPASEGSIAVQRYDAAGDEAMTVGEMLQLEKPFRLGRGLMKRLRRREVNVKEAFTICDGSGLWFRASLKECDAEGGWALPYERMERCPEAGIEITLACAVLARQRMLFVMQKATELGVRRVVPLLTEHSVPREGLAHENAHAWWGHVTRAAKQCRRGSLPQVGPPTGLEAFLELKAVLEADACVYLDDRSEGWPEVGASPRRVVLVVGPEGGFSDRERTILACKARPWVLGGRVLRAETAVVVGLTAVQMVWGDFSRPCR